VLIVDAIIGYLNLTYILPFVSRSCEFNKGLKPSIYENEFPEKMSRNIKENIKRIKIIEVFMAG